MSVLLPHFSHPIKYTIVFITGVRNTCNLIGRKEYNLVVHCTLGLDTVLTNKQKQKQSYYLEGKNESSLI